MVNHVASKFLTSIRFLIRARQSLLRTAAVILVLALSFSTAPSWAESLTAQADRAAISQNETLTLRVKFSGKQVQGAPDFSGLNGQFDILSNQTSSQHSIINGRVTMFTEWTLMLAPKNTGQLLIPPFSLQGQTSNPITIKVSRAATTNQSGLENVFVKASIDKTEAFVNEQFMVTFTMFYNQSVDSLDKPDIEIPNARIHELNRVDYKKALGHTTYGVAEYRFIVFPDDVGTIEIPAQRWQVRTTDQPNAGRFSFGRGNIRLYRPKTEALTIEIKPQPDKYPVTAPWLPASNVTISEKWSQAPATLTVGEPITWTITIDAKGTTSEQIPPLLEGLQPQGFKIYPDQPSHDTSLTNQSVNAVRTESVALVPSAAGELVLPAVELYWWDTQAKTVKVARLAERRFNVKAAQGAPAVASPSTPALVAPATSNPLAPPVDQPSIPSWMYGLVMLLFISNGVFLFLWINNKNSASAKAQSKPEPGGTNTTITVGELSKLCTAGKEPQLHQALTQWARQIRPKRSQTGLQSLIQTSSNPSFHRAIQNLEAHLYHDGSKPVDFSVIKAELAKLTKMPTASANQQLKPLYAA